MHAQDILLKFSFKRFASAQYLDLPGYHCKTDIYQNLAALIVFFFCLFVLFEIFFFDDLW